MEKIIDKIKKIMELASRGSTEAERETAMLQAQKLLDRHNLSMSQIDSGSDKKYEKGDDIKTSSVNSTLETCVCGIIMKYYNVQIVVFKEKDEFGFLDRSLKMFGRKHNVSVATYMYSWLTGELDQLWNDYKYGNGLKGNKSKTSFITGVYSGLNEKLKAQRESVVKEYTGTMDVAVLDETDQIMNWLKENMDIKKGNKQKFNINDDDAYMVGRIQGKKINIAEQIGS